MRRLAPDTIAPPLARYAPGVEIPAGFRLAVLSGQLGVTADGSVPDSVTEQAAICFRNIEAILAEAHMGRADLVRISAFLTDRSHLSDYMKARDAWLGDIAPPASTLLLISGFSRPEFLVEIEVIAAAP